MSRVRLEELPKNTIFMLSEARLENFLKENKIRAPKFIILLLNLQWGLQTV